MVFHRATYDNNPQGSNARQSSCFFVICARINVNWGIRLLMLLLFFPCFCFGQNYEWAFNMGGAVSGDWGFGIAADPGVTGDVYVTGRFSDIADFDPSGNIANLTSNGDRDIYVAKYDAAGNYLWAFNIGGTDWDQGQSIAIDPAGSGDVYVTGAFEGTADFDPSANTANLTSNSDHDIFIAKYDANGNYLWAFSIGGIFYDYGNDITIDTSGDVYVTGRFQNTADFDPSANTVNLTPNSNADIFIAKYDADGNYLWAFNVGGVGGGSNNGTGIDIDTAGSGDVYVTGVFGGTADFDPSGNTANLTSNGWGDTFIAKYDANGNYLWAFSVADTNSTTAYSISLNPTGNGDIHIIGDFAGTVDFDPSANTANLTSNGDLDVFVAKYDANGTYQWAFNIGETNWDRGNDITTDTSGNVYITGIFEGTADFDPSPNTINLTSNGGCDVFVAKYDASARYQWAFNVGATNDDRGYGIATDPAGSGVVYVTGFFAGTADFDPSGNTANFTSNGWTDVFVAKYHQSAPVAGFSVISDTICENDCINFTDVSTNSPTSWMWYFPGGTPSTSSAQNPTNICYDTAGTYSVSLTVFNYLGSDSITSTNYITVEVCIGVKENTNANTFTIYPNPATNEFTIIGNYALPATLELYDITGRQVFRQPVTSNKQQINVGNLSAGLYIYYLLSDGKAGRGKLILK